MKRRCDMNEKQMKIIDTIAARWAARLAEEEKARLQRAVEALKGGAVRFLRAGDEIRVINGEGRSYKIRRSEDRWQCSCPDFMNRGKVNGWRCKHLLAYFLAERAGLVAEPSPNGHEPSEPEEASGAQPQPQPQPAQAAPTGEGLDPVVPWGKRKGQRLSQIAQEDPEYLFFLARRMEPRSDEDRVLQEAARTLLADLVAEAVERAFADPAAMPVLPFGEEKGTPLTKCHPKWVAVLAKKGTEDARSFQDLVLYEVARRIQAQRQAKKRQARASLDAEVFLRAVQEVARETAREAVREAVLAALEAVREREADQEAILTDLADLRRRVERLERALGALRHAAEREAALAAR
jgi:predicted nucleic acid-binding Zn finger protein